MATGLDTRGLASGFAQGFGMADQYYTRQARGQRAEEKLGMQREKFDATMGALEDEQDLKDIQFTLGKIANGMEVSDDEVELLRKHPKYWAALDPDTDQAIQQADAVMNPENPADMNDPESLRALNQMFGTEVGKGEGGGKLVTGLYPSPDGNGVMMDLEVTTPEGETYNAPMTEGRSNREDDDTVKNVPVDTLIQKTQGMRALRQAFQNPSAQQRASQVLSLLRGDTDNWETIEHPQLGMIQRNTSTGEIKPISPGAGSPHQYSPRGAGSRDPSRIREARLLVANGVAGSFDEAYEMVRSRAGEGQRANLAHLDYLSEEIDRVQEQLERYPSQEEEDRLNRQLESLVEQRREVANASFNSGSPQPAPEPEPEPKPDPGSSGGGGNGDDGTGVVENFREKFGY